jgi:hypothetical protein
MAEIGKSTTGAVLCTQSLTGGRHWLPPDELPFCLTKTPQSDHSSASLIPKGPDGTHALAAENRNLHFVHVEQSRNTVPTHVDGLIVTPQRLRALCGRDCPMIRSGDRRADS